MLSFATIKSWSAECLLRGSSGHSLALMMVNFNHFLRKKRLKLRTEDRIALD